MTQEKIKSFVHEKNIINSPVSKKYGLKEERNTSDGSDDDDDDIIKEFQNGLEFFSTMHHTTRERRTESVLYTDRELLGKLEFNDSESNASHSNKLRGTAQVQRISNIDFAIDWVNDSDKLECKEIEERSDQRGTQSVAVAAQSQTESSSQEPNFLLESEMFLSDMRKIEKLSRDLNTVGSRKSRMTRWNSLTDVSQAFESISHDDVARSLINGFEDSLSTVGLERAEDESVSMDQEAEREYSPLINSTTKDISSMFFNLSSEIDETQERPTASSTNYGLSFSLERPESDDDHVSIYRSRIELQPAHPLGRDILSHRKHQLQESSRVNSIHSLKHGKKWIGGSIKVPAREEEISPVTTLKQRNRIAYGRRGERRIGIDRTEVQEEKISERPTSSTSSIPRNRDHRLNPTELRNIISHVMSETKSRKTLHSGSRKNSSKLHTAEKDDPLVGVSRMKHVLRSRLEKIEALATKSRTSKTKFEQGQKRRRGSTQKFEHRKPNTSKESLRYGSLINAKNIESHPARQKSDRRPKSVRQRQMEYWESLNRGRQIQRDKTAWKCSTDMMYSSALSSSDSKFRHSSPIRQPRRTEPFTRFEIEPLCGKLSVKGSKRDDLSARLAIVERLVNVDSPRQVRDTEESPIQDDVPFRMGLRPHSHSCEKKKVRFDLTPQSRVFPKEQQSQSIERFLLQNALSPRPQRGSSISTVGTPLATPSRYENLEKDQGSITLEQPLDFDVNDSFESVKATIARISDMKQYIESYSSY